MDDRLLLDKIDYENGTSQLDGKTYKLNRDELVGECAEGAYRTIPTVDRDDPYRLSEGEDAVMERLSRSFANCEKLQSFLFAFCSPKAAYTKCITATCSIMVAFRLMKMARCCT